MSFVHRLLSFGPVLFGLCAAAVFAVGIFLQTQQNNAFAQNGMALVEGPPNAVNLQDFETDRDVNSAAELALRAQVPFDLGARLTRQGPFGDQVALMVPLFAPGSAERAPLGFAMWTGRGFTFDQILPMVSQMAFEDVHAFGPVTTLLGKSGGYADWDSLARQGFEAEGLEFPADPIVIFPYIDARESYLPTSSDSGATIFGTYSRIGGTLALLALLTLALRPRRPEQTEEDDPEREHAPTPERGLRAAAPAEEQVDYADPDELLPRRKGLSVQKVLIGIVGAAFVVVFAAVLFGLFSDLAAQEAEGEPASVTVFSPELSEANRIAADWFPPPRPGVERRFDEIDLSSVARWFVVQAVLALSGDKTAMALLGAVLLGVVTFLGVLRYYFVMRRSLSPIRQASLSDMGIN